MTNPEIPDYLVNQVLDLLKQGVFLNDFIIKCTDIVNEYNSKKIALQSSRQSFGFNFALDGVSKKPQTFSKIEQYEKAIQHLYPEQYKTQLNQYNDGNNSKINKNNYNKLDIILNSFNTEDQESPLWQDAKKKTNELLNQTYTLSQGLPEIDKLIRATEIKGMPDHIRSQAGISNKIYQLYQDFYQQGLNKAKENPTHTINKTGYDKIKEQIRKIVKAILVKLRLKQKDTQTIFDDDSAKSDKKKTYADKELEKSAKKAIEEQLNPNQRL